jgi:two-component system, OmpR family, heavy metal sensor histidine kinase CusS
VNRQSIRFRLTAWYAAILAVTFAAVGIGVWLAIRDSINDTVDKDLRSRLQSMRDFLQKEAAGNEAPVDELIEHAALAPAGERFRIADSGGRWLYQSPGTEGWNAPPPDPSRIPKRGRVETVIRKGKPVRVLSAPLPPGVIQIGTPVDEFAEMLDAFTWTALLASPLLLILASASGYWMSRRALAPVERIARTAGEIEAQNLSERLPLRGTGDELDHLSATLNAMFARLEDSFRRITQFTADASHELRTPVAIIRTTAEVIRRKPRSESEYAEALDRILAESERTTELIEGLMLLARSDANTDDAVLQPVALAGLVQTACADARVLAEAAGMTLTSDGLSQCTVSGDDHALRRLLLILLDNAIKYSKPRGEVRMCLRLCRRGDRPMAVLEVRDNGIGISPDHLPHIFERFYRASKDRSRKVDGVGLGLSIAQSIAQRHGGEIQVESQLGQGSTVRVFLPIT